VILVNSLGRAGNTISPARVAGWVILANLFSWQIGFLL
jgi:hypothetical protein